MANILHITAHLGGGVGKILCAICCTDSKNSHKILCMEETKNKHFYKIIYDSGIEILEKVFDEKLFDWTDIVEVEWWHHPKVTQFMVETLSKIETRLLVWSHISGCNYPYITSSFIRSVDQFLFTSEYSYENPFFIKEDIEYIRNNCDVVNSVATNFDFYVHRKSHDKFSVGYLGYLGYSKLSEKFVDLCKSISHIPNIVFPIIGDLSCAKDLLHDIKNSGISNKFQILGYRTNVFEDLFSMDVFGYPLYSNHTGTTENALLEAMAAGVVPVVFNQCCEKYIVKDQETGIIVNTPEDYRTAIYRLYKDKSFLKKLSDNCQRYIRENFSLSITIEKLNQYYIKLLKTDKKYHEDLINAFGETPFEWFKSCYIGDLDNIRGLAMAENKASLRQYFSYFPQDKQLEMTLRRSEDNNGRNQM